MGRGKKPQVASARPIKVGEQVRAALSEALRDGAFALQTASLVTITEAKMTPDLKTARVFVSIYGEDGEAVVEMLQPHVAQREIARRLKLRFTPKVTFSRDESIAYGAKMEQLIKEVLPPVEDEDGEEEEAL